MVIKMHKLVVLIAVVLVVGAVFGCSHSSAPPPAPTPGAAAPPPVSDIQKHMALKAQQLKTAKGMMQKH